MASTPHPLAQVNQGRTAFEDYADRDWFWRHMQWIEWENEQLARETELQAILRRNAERIREQDQEEDQHNGR